MRDWWRWRLTRGTARLRSDGPAALLWSLRVTVAAVAFPLHEGLQVGHRRLHVAAMRRLYPRADTVVIDGADHTMAVTHRAEYYAAIDEFLETATR